MSWRDERADVDPHVEDREAGVAARAAFGIQVADDRRDVRLEQARAEDDEDEAEEERRGCANTDESAIERWPSAMSTPPVPDRAPQPEQRSAIQPPGSDAR